MSFRIPNDNRLHSSVAGRWGPRTAPHLIIKCWTKAFLMKFVNALLTLAFCAPSTAFVSSRRTFVSTLVGGTSKIIASNPNPTKTVLGRRMMSQSPQDFIESQITSNKVTVFSKSYCPYCTSTKSLLDEMKVDYQAIELDKREDGAAIQSALVEKTGQRTVPNTFIGKEQVGGNDKLQAAAKNGTLKKMLGI
jgi:glutaredoxin 3